MKKVSRSDIEQYLCTAGGNMTDPLFFVDMVNYFIAQATQATQPSDDEEVE